MPPAVMPLPTPGIHGLVPSPSLPVPAPILAPIPMPIPMPSMPEMPNHLQTSLPQ